MEIISAWELYLWTRLDVFDGAGWGLISLFGFLLGGVFWIMSSLNPEDTDAIKIKPIAKIAFIVGCIMILLSAAIPTKKDMAMIYVFPKLANSETLQKEAGEIYDIAKSALKEYAGVKEDE